MPCRPDRHRELRGSGDLRARPRRSRRLPRTSWDRRRQQSGGTAGLPGCGLLLGWRHRGMMGPRDRLIVALDVPTADAARALVDRLAGRVGLFKVGHQLFTAAGPALVHEIVARGERVFLDLKYHDIPNTVAGAVASAAQLGVSLLNVHGLGGRAMMEAAVRALPATGARLLAVTVLTSHDDASLAEIGVGGPASSAVDRLARLARDCGMD